MKCLLGSRETASANMCTLQINNICACASKKLNNSDSSDYEQLFSSHNCDTPQYRMESAVCELLAEYTGETLPQSQTSSHSPSTRETL